jgi:hypothetical protein
MTDELTSALEKDLGKSKFVSELTSIMPCLWDVEYSLERVEQVRNELSDLDFSL